MLKASHPSSLRPHTRQVGMFFGAFISLIVDSALFEIGKSPFFASVFGVCLMVIGMPFSENAPFQAFKALPVFVCVSPEIYKYASLKTHSLNWRL